MLGMIFGIASITWSRLSDHHGKKPLARADLLSICSSRPMAHPLAYRDPYIHKEIIFVSGIYKQQVARVVGTRAGGTVIDVVVGVGQQGPTIPVSVSDVVELQ